MAQGGIRKGFFFYFGLFVLLLVTIFLICMVIMIFNPGSTILWMQYFTANNKYYIEETSDNRVIDYSQVSTINIECDYAQVSVYKNKEYSKAGVYIINKAKGFTIASTAVPFGYETMLSGTTLSIELNEPNGFLYFSKDIEIVIFAPENGTDNLANTKLNIVTNDGDVSLGMGTDRSEEFTLKGLDVKAKGKANIIFGDEFVTSGLETLSVSTESGKIYSLREITYESNKTAKGIQANCDASFEIMNGNINFGAINLGGHTLSITSKKGDVAIDWANADIMVKCVQGNYKFGKINGDLNYQNSEDIIISPNIMADYISGDFSLTTNANVDSDPDINIKEIQGKITLFAKKGRLQASKIHGAMEVVSESELVLDVVVADGNSNLISVDNEAGDIKLGFLGSVGNVLIKSNRADTTFNITSVAKFVSTCYVNDPIDSDSYIDDSKISVSHGLNQGVSKNPLAVDGTSAYNGTITVKTNAKVSYNLVQVSGLSA